MKNLFLLLALSFSLTTTTLRAQDDLSLLLLAGIEDTKVFAEDYLRPGAEGFMYNLSNGWYQTAEVKGFLNFEISLIGNVSVNLDEYKSFTLNTADYHNLNFADGETQKEVATILGENNQDVAVMVNYDTPWGTTESMQLSLPQGLGSSEIAYLPTAFLQGRLGIFKGTELKVRYFPKMKYEDVEAEIYGAAIQHELSSWIPGFDVLPVVVSGIVAFTHMKGDYNFTEEEYIVGANQHLNTQMDSWLFSAIASTNFPVINFYAGIGYVKGKAETDMLGTYVVVDENSGQNIVSVKDPFSLTHEISGIKSNLGISLKLGIVKFTADYNFQEYGTISAGVHIGI